MEDVAESSQNDLYYATKTFEHPSGHGCGKSSFSWFFFQRNYNVEQFSIQTRNFHNNFHIVFIAIMEMKRKDKKEPVLTRISEQWRKFMRISVVRPGDHIKLYWTSRCYLSKTEAFSTLTVCCKHRQQILKYVTGLRKTKKGSWKAVSSRGSTLILSPNMSVDPIFLPNKYCANETIN